MPRTPTPPLALLEGAAITCPQVLLGRLAYTQPGELEIVVAPRTANEILLWLHPLENGAGWGVTLDNGCGVHAGYSTWRAACWGAVAAALDAAMA